MPANPAADRGPPPRPAAPARQVPPGSSCRAAVPILPPSGSRGAGIGAIRRVPGGHRDWHGSCATAADGIEGARKRIELARKYLPKFGIATECGFARARKPGLVQDLLAIHAGATKPSAAA